MDSKHGTNGARVRVALYARVSGEEQTIGRNIEAQVDELRRQLPPSYEVVGVYLDEGISGAVPLAERPQGSRLMRDAEAERFDQLLATKLDRVGRSVVDIRQVAERLAGMGISLKAQGLEFGQNPHGRLMLSVLAAMAEFERDLIRERMLSGKRFKAKALGRWPGGTVPFGYGYEKGEPGERGRWQVIDEEAKLIRRIFLMCAHENLGLSGIADRLSDEGVSTPSARLADPVHPRTKPKIRVGKRWERSHVGRFLRNPAYIGRLFVGIDGERGKVTPTELVNLIRTDALSDSGLTEIRVPAIVEDSLWWAAQDKLDARRRLPNPHYETWPLQSRVTCASDGRVFKCRRDGQTGPRKYSCAGREARGTEDRPRCTAPRLSADKLESALVWHLNGILASGDTARTAVGDYLANLERLQEEGGRSLEPILKKLEELAAEEDRLGELYIKGRLQAEKYEAKLSELLLQRQSLEDARSKRQRELHEFEQRRVEIDRIRAAIAENRLSVSWRPSARQLSVTIFRQPMDEAEEEIVAFASPPVRPALTNARSPRLPRGQAGFDEVMGVEHRIETAYDLRQLIELFDINIVVYEDHIEVRGVFPTPTEITLDRVDEVLTFQSLAGTKHHARSAGRTPSSRRQR